jgi:hypothetical protein
MMLPAPTVAFKEWHVVVEALGAGEQILVLRKGGIAEGKGGFSLKAEAFWLFPTHFHAQLEKTKPAAAQWYSAGAETTPAAVSLRYFARVVKSAFLNDWSAVQALDPYHVWTEQTVRERFEWSRPPGVFAMAVRVYRAEEALVVPLTPEMAGCKSWVDLPVAATSPSSPVLGDDQFSAKIALLRL